MPSNRAGAALKYPVLVSDAPYVALGKYFILECHLRRPKQTFSEKVVEFGS